MALATLKQAFTMDVAPILAMARQCAGGAIDPIGTYRASGYRQHKAEERPAAMVFWLSLSWIVVVSLYHVVGTSPKLYRRCVCAHILSGAVFDLTGSYRAAFVNGLLWNLVNVSIALWLLRQATLRPSLA